MDIQKIITELKAEREQIEEAIFSLERLAVAGGRRRGRPPKWMTEAAKVTGAVAPVKRRGRPAKNAAVATKKKPGPKKRASRSTDTEAAAESA